jgi:hypothetical protein
LPEIGVKSNGLSCNWTKLHCLQPTTPVPRMT